MVTKNLGFLRLIFAVALVLSAMAATMGSLSAASGAIGLAVANGGFQLNNGQVWGSATLLDGNSIRTAAAPLDVSLHNGAKVRLAAGSLAIVYGRKVVLEEGI